jgi:60 kDa SS-A/Ro ribonucleoprotein
MNKNIFKTSRGGNVPATNAVNEAGGKAYQYDDKTAAAVFAMTATFPDKAFYLSGEDQLDQFTQFLDKCDPEFVAKLSVYARQRGKMKDAPVLAVLSLAKRDKDLFNKVFGHVADTPVQYRNAFQIVRSGVLGFKSLGSTLTRAFERRLFEFGVNYLARRGLVGQKPSLSDVIAMVRPTPPSEEWRAFFGYVRGHSADSGYYNPELLPEIIRDFEAFKKDPKNTPIPKGIEHQQVIGMLPKDAPAERWGELLRIMSWTQIVKNLATLTRHGAFDDKASIRYAAEVLRNSEKIRSSKMLPMQLFSAYRTLTGDTGDEYSYGYRSRKQYGNSDPVDVSHEILAALSDAFDVILVEKTPDLPGNMVLGVDSSGSMTWGSITGDRGSASSTVRPIDAAAMFASAALTRNPKSVVVPFDTSIGKAIKSRGESTLGFAKRLTGVCRGGGTNISLVMDATLAKMDKEKGWKPDHIVILSDNESWVDGGYRSRGTATMSKFKQIKARAPECKLVCWNLQASATTQAVGDDVLQVGGFSEELWSAVATFLRGEKAKVISGPETREAPSVDADTWLEEIESIPLDETALAAWVSEAKKGQPRV